MTSDEIEELRVFLRDTVSSFEELEVLLFFVRAARRAWGATELATALGLASEVVEAALAQLAAAGAPITPSSDGPTTASHRFTPDLEQERLLDGLRRAYDDQRLTILQIMSANAMERVRSMAARRLADAFRIDRSKK